MLKRTLLAVITVLLTFSAAGAEMYQRVDAKDAVTFKDAKTARQLQTAENERFTGTVELYVTDWCGYCKKTQKYLTDRGIPYVAYDIEKDSAANARHKALGGQGVPLIIIGKNKISGFSPKAIDYYLNNSK